MRTRVNRAGSELSIRWRESKAALCPILKSSKLQVPSSRETSNTKLQKETLVLGSSLELGAWNLELRLRRGFTLIELLIVMGIISILAALLLPTLAVIRERTRKNLAR